MDASASTAEPAVTSYPTARVGLFAQQQESAGSCFHCGLPVPPGSSYRALIEGVEQPCCCVGCQAISQAICDQGLGAFYARRNVFSDKPDAADAEFTHFDDEKVLASVAKPLGGGVWESALVIEGVTCSACVWLFEERVRSLPGVLELDSNYATRKAVVRWNQNQAPFSRILSAVREIGLTAWPSDSARAQDMAAKERRSMLWRLFVAGFAMMQVMMYAYPVYIAGEADMSFDQLQLMRIAGLVLTFPVLVFSASTFFLGAWRDLRMRQISMDLPIAIGIGAAFLSSCWATFQRNGDVYFDSITMFVFLVLCARFLEKISRDRAAESINSLKHAAPAFANQLAQYPANRKPDKVAVSVLTPGQYVWVAAGEAFPVDARIVEGATSADEALLTGESRLLPKIPGDEVLGGSINAAQPVVIQVARQVAESQLANIVRLVERAQSQRPQFALFADRVARAFVAVVLVLAAIAFAGWWLIDPGKALWVAVAVLVVSCPCALSLATPAALAASTSALAKRGFVITRGTALERLAMATHFVFDKTGTLTEGQIRILEAQTLSTLSRERCESIAAALQRGVNHPIAKAFATDSTQFCATQLVLRHGFGVEGVVNDRWYRLGSRAWIESWCVADHKVARAEPCTHTEVVLADQSAVLAVFHLGDRMRADAAELVAELKAQGKTLLLATGDQAGPAAEVARQVGIERVHHALSPEAKLQLIRELQSQGARVAVVGDGLNDAPVLGEAFVSLAMGSGALLAQVTADIVVLGSRLRAIAEGLSVAVRTRTIIRQNLVWAFAYNVTLIPLAMAGWVSPWLTGIGMALSSALVVMNAMRLHRIVGARTSAHLPDIPSPLNGEIAPLRT